MATPAKPAFRSTQPAAVGNVTTTNVPDDPPMLPVIFIALITLPGSACSRTELAYRNDASSGKSMAYRFAASLTDSSLERIRPRHSSSDLF